MKIICTQENLKAGLQTVGKITSTNQTLPVLSNVLLKTENGMLGLVGTNLEVAVTTQVRCKTEEDGAVTVSSKTLGELIANTPNKNLSLYTTPGMLFIEAENYHTSLKTLPAEDFPIIPKVERKGFVKISTEVLKKTISQTAFAVSQNTTQPEITGLLLSFKNNGLVAAATDRYRLAEKKLKAEGEGEIEMILPPRAVAEVSRIASQAEGDVEIGFSSSQAEFVFNGTVLVTRLIDGQYPPYGQIIPSAFNTEIVCPRQPLISALRAGGIFSQNGNSVNIGYNSETQKLVLSSESGDLGSNRVDLESRIQGQAGSMVVNHHYLLDCLLSVSSDEVVIKVVDDSSPVVLIPKGEDDYIYLVMPIKV